MNTPLNTPLSSFNSRHENGEYRVDQRSGEEQELVVVAATPPKKRHHVEDSNSHGISRHNEASFYLDQENSNNRKIVDHNNNERKSLSRQDKQRERSRSRDTDNIIRREKEEEEDLSKSNKRRRPVKDNDHDRSLDGDLYLETMHNSQSHESRYDDKDDDDKNSLFDLSTRCIPMTTFLNGLPISIHKFIHQKTQKSLWDRLYNVKPLSLTAKKTGFSSTTTTLESCSILEETSQQEILLQATSNEISIAGFSFSSIVKLYNGTMKKPDDRVPNGGVPNGGVPNGGVPSGGVPNGGVPNGEVLRKDEQWKPKSSQPSSTSVSSVSSHPAKRENAQVVLTPTSSSLHRHDQRPQGSNSNRRPRCRIDEIVQQKQRPIILVPTQLNDLINDNNVLEFLANGRFFDNNEKSSQLQQQQQQSNSYLPSISDAGNSRTCVTRVIRDKPFKFRLVQCSRATRFSHAEWSAVVAVILSGPEWQLAGWPFKKVEDVFKSMKGFYFAYTDALIPPAMLKWNVQVMRIFRNQRHYDRPMQNEFWKSLESFVLLSRSEVFIDTTVSLQPSTAP